MLSFCLVSFIPTCFVLGFVLGLGRAWSQRRISRRRRKRSGTRRRSRRIRRRMEKMRKMAREERDGAREVEEEEARKMRMEPGGQ